MSRKKKVLPYETEVNTGTEGSILSKIYRTILTDLGMDRQRYEALMNKYIQRSQHYPDRVQRAAARASLNKELLKESMTWKTFIKGLVFLRLWKIDITIRAYHMNQRVTEHRTTVNFGEIEGLQDESTPPTPPSTTAE